VPSERFTRQTLKVVATQTVQVILQPGSCWAIQTTLRHDEETEAALRTCYIRGWIEPLTEAIPQGRLTDEGNLPDGPMFTGESPLWRLTEAGWHVIHRMRAWVVATCFIAGATLVVALMALFFGRL
jgi:hypothetical protein